VEPLRGGAYWDVVRSLGAQSSAGIDIVLKASSLSSHNGVVLKDQAWLLPILLCPVSPCDCSLSHAMVTSAMRSSLRMSAISLQN
jgi:hypothetical protein